jgi:hypothetical protein
MRNAFIISSFIMASVFQGCGQDDPPDKKASPQTVEIQPGEELIEPVRDSIAPIIEGSGTVVFLPIEGGFFGIISDDGAKYDPTNLEPGFKKQGLKIKFTARTRRDVESVHMWGTMIDIIEMGSLHNYYPPSHI